MAKKDTHFSIDSWNHPCFVAQGIGDYHMVWGPYPLNMKQQILDTVVKNFAPGTKHLVYNHQDESKN